MLHMDVADCFIELRKVWPAPQGPGHPTERTLLS